MIKAVIFDFDNTLIFLAEAHYIALNEAIEEIAGKQYIITQEEQNLLYNGLSTKTKLNKLIQNKNLPHNLIDIIFHKKQEKTIKYITENILPNKVLYNDLFKLKSEGYKLYCASNALFETVGVGLSALGIIDLFDYIVGNDDIKNQKPHSEIFLKCFIHAGLDPKECLIVEDSKFGIESAYRSGANVLTVSNPKDLTYDYIHANLDRKLISPAINTRLNILIPMAGAGSRFGGVIKPLVDVLGKPMIQRVIESLNIDANYLFIVQDKHFDQLKYILPLLKPNCKIIQTNGLTDGAACTSLLAKTFIDNNNPLLIANCDQIIDYDAASFLSSANNCDGTILTFEANETKWSYARVEKDIVVEVAEKRVISNKATVGIYYYKRGADYIKYAEQMIVANDRFNNEFYIAPVYNYAIRDNKKIKCYDVNKMNGIGTPGDLANYLQTKKCDI